MWGFRWLWCALYSFWVCSKLSMWKDMASDQSNFSKRPRPVSVLAALKHMVWFLHSEGTQSDLRRSHSRGQILLGRTYLRCLEPGALVLLDSCNAAHSCKLFSKSSLTGSLISQYPLNAENCCWTIGVWWRISHYGQWTICASSDCLWHRKTVLFIRIWTLHCRFSYYFILLLTSEI